MTVNGRIFLLWLKNLSFYSVPAGAPGDVNHIKLRMGGR